MRARAGARNHLSGYGAVEGEVASRPTPGDRDVASFLAELRATYVSNPDEAVASRHLAAIAHEAELVQLRARRPASRRRTMIRNRLLRPVATLGAATLAAVLGTAGLAVAGVDLPDPATKAFEHAGISLPNQAGGGQSGEHGQSGEVHSVLNETPPSDRDCAFGHRGSGEGILAARARTQRVRSGRKGQQRRAPQGRRPQLQVRPQHVRAGHRRQGSRARRRHAQ
jgi:hypothetical protein